MDQEEIMDKLKILGLIILAISLILIFKYESREEYYQKELPNEKFEGIIVDKFRDSTSHGAHVIVLMQGDKFEKITTDWWCIFINCAIKTILYPKNLVIDIWN